MIINHKKILRNIIIVLLSVLITTIAVYGVVYFLYYNYNEEISVRLTGDVIVINDLFSSMYLVKTDDGYIAIDTGYDRAIINRGLEYSKIKPEEITALFITHSDVDHQHAGELFYKARVYFPREEDEMIRNNISRIYLLPFIKNKNLFRNYILMNDKDSLKIGDKNIRCISLPGHTSGSMGYIIAGKYLFTGDAFRIKNGKLALPNRKFMVMDIDKMKRSIEKVAGLKGIKYIFSSNSGFTADFPFAVSK
jgi:glyoxylase-like metal-dependent hydrolase (beta-lactamase superfamily II)